MLFILGIIVLCGSLWEFWSAYKSIRTVRHNGTQGTSAFIVMGIWSGFMFGLILFGLSFALMFPKVAGF